MRLIHVDVLLKVCQGTLSAALETEAPADAAEFHQLFSQIEKEIWERLQVVGGPLSGQWEVFIETFDLTIVEPQKRRFLKWLKEQIGKAPLKWTFQPNGQVHLVRETDLVTSKPSPSSTD